MATISAAYLWETKLRDRVRIRRILNQDDEHVGPLLELYQKLFEDDGTNYSLEEVLEILGDSSMSAEDRHVRSDNIILAAEGFPNQRRAILSWSS